MRVYVHTKIKCPYLSEWKNQICPPTATNGTHVRNKIFDLKQLQILLDLYKLWVTRITPPIRTPVVPWERHLRHPRSRSSSGWSSRGSDSLSPPSPTLPCDPRPVRHFRVPCTYGAPLRPGDAFYDAVKEKVE